MYSGESDETRARLRLGCSFSSIGERGGVRGEAKDTWAGEKSVRNRGEARAEVLRWVRKDDRGMESCEGVRAVISVDMM